MDKTRSSMSHVYVSVATDDEVTSTSSSSAMTTDARARTVAAEKVQNRAAAFESEREKPAIGTHVRRSTRWKRNCIRCSLTLLICYTLYESWMPLLYKPRYATFGPGEELEKQRRRHCNATTHFSVVRGGAGDSHDDIENTSALPMTSTSSVKGAFVLLIRGHADIDGYTSTRLWLEHILSRAPWIRKHDILFFHEGDVKESHQQYLMTGNDVRVGHASAEEANEAARMHVPIEFIDLSSDSTTAFTIPEWIPKVRVNVSEKHARQTLMRTHDVLANQLL